jgi:hypothetical protein
MPQRGIAGRIALSDRDPRYLLWVPNPRPGNLDDLSCNHFTDGVIAIDEAETMECLPIRNAQLLDLHR